MSFSAMKKNRKKSLAGLVEASAKLQENKYDNDDANYWKLSVDKSQNGSAVIRFLPTPENETVPWVRVFSHGFKDVGGWMIDNCPTTVGKECPVCKRNNELWNQGEGSQGRKIVSGSGNDMPGSKRKLAYISNIYVVKDPANPENNGKVFLFKYGKKIFDAVNDQMNPSFEDDEAMNPFDLWEGADFRLKARKVDGYRNYDKSTFDAPSPLLSTDDSEQDDKDMEEIWKQEFSLSEFIADDKFTSYEDMETRLLKVIGNTSTYTESDDIPEQAPAAEPKSTSPKPAPKAETVDLNDDDDDNAFFDSLSDDD